MSLFPYQINQVQCISQTLYEKDITERMGSFDVVLYPCGLVSTAKILSSPIKMICRILRCY